MTSLSPVGAQQLGAAENGENASDVTIDTQTTHEAAFSEDAKKNRCLCGILHITQGTYAVGVALSVGFVLMIVQVILEWDAEGHEEAQPGKTESPKYRPSEARFIAEIIGIFFLIAASYALVVYGVYKQKRVFLLPFLLMSVIHLFVLAVIIIEVSILLPGSASPHKGELVAELLVSLLDAFLTMWFACTISRCWRYLGDKADALRAVAHPVTVTNA